MSWEDYLLEPLDRRPEGAGLLPDAGDLALGRDFGNLPKGLIKEAESLSIDPGQRGYFQIVVRFAELQL